MTLIVALLNDRSAILLADRRLTVGRNVVDNHYNKVTVLCCHDARVGIAFTGLARTGSFDTNEHIMKFLDAATYIDDKIDTIATDLAASLTKRLLALGLMKHPLTIVLIGYRTGGAGSHCLLAQISNLSEKGLPQHSFAYETLPIVDDATAHVFGMHTAVDAQTRADLTRLAARKMEPQAALRKSVIVLDKAAANLKSNNTVGDRCNSVVILSEVNTPMVATYHVATTEQEAHGPNFVVTGHYYSYGSLMMAGEALAGSGSLKKNSPCWCGSRKRFKECHLKKFGSAYARHPQFSQPLTWFSRVPTDDGRPSGSLFSLSGGFA
jgi:SEC-C motif